MFIFYSRSLKQRKPSLAHNLGQYMTPSSSKSPKALQRKKTQQAKVQPALQHCILFIPTSGPRRPALALGTSCYSSGRPAELVPTRQGRGHPTHPATAGAAMLLHSKQHRPSCMWSGRLPTKSITDLPMFSLLQGLILVFKVKCVLIIFFKPLLRYSRLFQGLLPIAPDIKRSRN